MCIYGYASLSHTRSVYELSSRFTDLANFSSLFPLQTHALDLRSEDCFDAPSHIPYAF